MHTYLRLFISALLLFVLSSFIYQQKTKSDQISGRAIYHFFHIRDTMNTGRIWEEDFQLKFNSEKSLYTSYTRIQQDSIQKAKLQAAINSGSTRVEMGLFVPSSPESIFTNESQKVVYVNRTFAETSYLIKEEMDQIKWKIGKETKNMLGYACQQATGICKGRKYTAWFSTDIPISFGPWKLQGLPGLILEAYDDSQRIKFTCTSVNVGPGLAKDILALSSDATLTTLAEYSRMEKAFSEGSSAGSFSASGAMIEKVAMQSDPQVRALKRIIVNNPLELTH